MRLAILCMMAVAGWAQFPPGSSAASAVGPRGVALPATCSVGRLFMVVTPAEARGVCGCTAPNEWTCASTGAGTGTVTSVALALPDIFAVSGSPVMAAGTITATLANQNANTVFAGPASGGAGTPGFRTLVAADIPPLTLPVIGAYTVAGLPAAGTAGRVAVVTDAATAGSCTSGGGTALALCRDSGSAWVPLGDGGSGGGGELAIQVGGEAAGTASTLNFEQGTYVTLAGSCVGSTCTLTVNSSVTTASSETLGLVKVGTGLAIVDGVLSVTGAGSTTIEISNNDNTLQGTAARVQFKNGAGVSWAFVDEGSGRIAVTPSLDTTELIKTTGPQTRAAGLTVEAGSIGTSYQTWRLANGSPGTTQYHLAKVSTTGAATISGSGETDRPLWVVMSGAGTTDSAELLTQGLGSLQMVGDCTLGQPVVQSNAEGQGFCTSTPSAGAYVVGYAAETGTGAGYYDFRATTPFRWGVTTALTSVTRQYGAHFNSPAAEQVQYFRVPEACTITGWQILAVGGTSPTATLDVWLVASGTALPTVSDTITASAKPALATGNAIKSTTLTGWTTAVTADMIGAVRIDAISGSPTSIQATVYCQQ